MAHGPNEIRGVVQASSKAWNRALYSAASSRARHQIFDRDGFDSDD